MILNQEIAPIPDRIRRGRTESAGRVYISTSRFNLISKLEVLSYEEAHSKCHIESAGPCSIESEKGVFNLVHKDACVGTAAQTAEHWY